jgi:hypothetical protein
MWGSKPVRNTRPPGHCLRKTVWLFALVLGPLFLATSGDCVPPAISDLVEGLLGDRPLAELTDSQQNVVFEDQGTIIVVHGFGCAKSDRAGTQVTLKIEQSINVPAYAKNATVFLNGWRLQYGRDDEDVDHHVKLVKTAIRHVKLEGQTLRWEAIGELSDRDAKDAYGWCYRFTAFAWDPSKISVAVDDQDGVPDKNGIIPGQKLFAGQNFFAPSAGIAFPRFVLNAAFDQNAVAILPRGFLFGLGDNDHHLLQLAYNLDHSERFIDVFRKYVNQDKDQLPELVKSQFNSSFASWETAVIFKDDKDRDYGFGELVSVLSGPDVRLIQPPFVSEVVRPNCSRFCGTTTQGRPKSEEFVIDNIPFDYAIPVLTGWELRYLTRDQHVKEMGVWIDEVHYEKNPLQLGRLRYKLVSVLRDKDGFPIFVSRHRVTVVGLRPIAGGPPIRLTK